ncbi:MAG: flagellin biosynthesis protein FlgK, partial [Thermoproteus sp.]
TATTWDNWSLNYTGTLYIPWNNPYVGVWHDDGAAVSVCGQQVISALYFTSPRFDSARARCAAGPNQVVVEYFEGYVEAVLMFVVGPPNGQSAYVPTIDGAWYCSNFNWGSGSYYSGAGTCNSGWTFLPASSGNVPYWIVGKYAPGSSDGGGSPSP